MGRTSDAKERLIASAIELIHARSYADVGVNDVERDAEAGKTIAAVEKLGRKASKTVKCRGGVKTWNAGKLGNVWRNGVG